MMKITGLSHQFKWENWWLYTFLPHCILVRSGCDEGGMCVFVSSRVFVLSRGFVDLWGCFHLVVCVGLWLPRLVLN